MLHVSFLSLAAVLSQQIVPRISEFKEEEEAAAQAAAAAKDLMEE
jgi:hypothetical protein